MRVLHVGNVGNNAYLNARFLRDAGVDCHVLSYDYYDALATPEWEGHERPPWFAQGPLDLCIDYLGALDDGDTGRQARLARRLRFERAVPPGLRYGVRRAKIAVASRRVRTAEAPAGASGNGTPAREDDAALFAPALPLWNELLPRYDLVQCYATDPIWPLLTGYRPYVAYEHGTLRVFTGDTDPVSRLTAAAYQASDHTFVTNGDCLADARRLAIPSFSPMVHPLDVEAHERADATGIERVRSSFGADVMLFCPMRHDWEVKGTDVHLRALPHVLERVSQRVVLVLCGWGRDLERSRRLVRELGLEAEVAWVEPMQRKPFIAHLHAADAVLDQMTLPHFDATAPQAIAAGAPVIGSYKPESTAWIVDEPAPILRAFSAEEVAERVVETLAPGFRDDYREIARAWIHAQHHPRRLVAEHLRVYRTLLDGVST